MSATYRLLLGDCAERLREMPAESVQTAITSPPYWGLRDYGADGQIGLEETPEAYVERLMVVFDEVRRVLRPDGTLWLNLGDSYAGSWGNQGRKAGRGTQRAINAPTMQNVGAVEHAIGCDMDGDCTCGALAGGVYPQRTRTGSWVKDHPTLKPKDLCGIPWRVAFALQARGWWLRQDIIWHKPNPMPAPVEDRCVTAHEYLFLLSKSARYFFDHEAIREEAVGEASGNKVRGETKQPEGRSGLAEGFPWTGAQKRNKRSVWTVTPQPFAEAHFATYPPALVEPCVLAGSRPGDTVLDPFTGSGTTGAVAVGLGRHFVGCEINPKYIEMARRRIGDVSPLFSQEVA